MPAETQDHPRQPFLRRVNIRNFKSIEGCRVDLAPLTILVGRNGSGKSNFLDAVRFVTDSLQASLGQALRDRGGLSAVLRRGTLIAKSFTIELELLLPSQSRLRYGFEIGKKLEADDVITVKHERFTLSSPDGKVSEFAREQNWIGSSSIGETPPVHPERLYLPNVAGFPHFGEAYAALTAMGFYDLSPDQMKKVQNPDANTLLRHDGGNIASVIGRLAAVNPQSMDRVTAYLQQIMPGLIAVERVDLGPGETLQFSQQAKGAPWPAKFYAASMSDGTLRALGNLVAVAQIANGTAPVNLVGFEEPETALHPAATGVLVDALREATSHTQVLVTTHSPDLCDQIDPEREGLFVVEMRDGVTRIAPADRASLKAIRSHLYLPGELLRMDQLELDAEDLERQRQLEQPAVTA